MKIAVILLLFATTILHGQTNTEARSTKKNSIGLFTSTESIGHVNTQNETPILGIDYRRLLNENNELRLSFGYQHSKHSLYGSSISFSAGLNRFFYKTPKVGIYFAPNLTYNRFSTVYSVQDSNFFESFSTDQVGVNLMLGAEYNASPRVSIFLEPKLVKFSIFESGNDNTQFQTGNLKFLNGTRMGLKYRF